MKRTLIVTIGVVVAILAWLLLAPPQAWLDTTRNVEPTAVVGAGLVDANDCRSCHRIAGEGALRAPNLDGVTERMTTDELRTWLADPSSVKPDTAMPRFRLSSTEMEAIIAYLNELDADR